MTSDGIRVRRASEDDIAGALEVAAAALGWDPTEPNEAFFRWKHLDNPAGRSPMWVAVDNDEICGFRAMLRWRFTDGDTPRSAVRAVDTATGPSHQRRGIFKKLTLTAIDDLTGNGVGFVFNTPNAKSMPGYLSMGWTDSGRLPVRFSIGGPGSLTRLARARTAADKWSEPLEVGTHIEEVLDELVEMLPLSMVRDGVGTDRTLDHLRWRYGFGPLHYRAIRTDEALAIVRVRRRGPAREAVLAEVFSPDARATGRLLRQVRLTLSTDHILTLGSAPHPARWQPTISRLGPHLTLRSLATEPPPVSRLRFSLGDIELF